MGGRVTLHAALARPDRARGRSCSSTSVPSCPPKGAKVIGDFVAHNIEFDDLEVFLDNVVRYDRFRSREHIARTVKYNLLVRADGKYVSKVDHRRLPGGSMREITLDERRRDHAARCCWCAASESDVLLPDAAERFVDALPDGRLGHGAERRPQRARRQHPRVPDAIGPFLDELVG